MRGYYNHVVHEHLIVCTRGSCLPDVPTPQPKSIQTIRRSHEHSAKPEEFRRLIETHWNRGPYLELFGRKKVDGWSVFGNDARLWTATGSKPATIEDEDIPF
jgi:N6-adenosine-specific RNA methylase IME4